MKLFISPRIDLTKILKFDIIKYKEKVVGYSNKTKNSYFGRINANQ